MAATVLLLFPLAMTALAACGGEQTSPAVATTVPATPTDTASLAETPEPTTGSQPAATQAPTDTPTQTPAPTAALEPTATPTPSDTPTPEPTATPPPTLRPGERLSLHEYAARFANGPGAIYVGDLSQLVGPAPRTTSGLLDADLGDSDGNVPLSALEDHRWLYESDYYQSLIEKANLTTPTELTSSGESIRIQHVCVNRALPPCKIIEQYWAPNLKARTNGQLVLEISSLSELDLSGPDTLGLVSDGTLSMANIHTAYVASQLPTIEIQLLWGIYPDWETMYYSQTDMHPELEELVASSTDGGIIVNHNWNFGNDPFFFSKRPLRTPEDFAGLRTRAFDSGTSNWINGMGAEPKFLAFTEMYKALEREILDVGLTGSTFGHGQRLYEVTTYLNGPLRGLPSTNNVINGDVWDGIPADLQKILIEEGAKSELEQLRLGAIQNVSGIQKNIDAGMELVEFTPELAEYSLNSAVIGEVIPSWVSRLGSSERGDAIAMFNDHVGPYVGLQINPDGGVITFPATKGPHAWPTWVPTVTLEYMEVEALRPWKVYRATPLHQAAINHEPIVAEMLLDYGFDVNVIAEIRNPTSPRAGVRRGFMPLHGAAGFNSNPDVTAMLLEQGANIYSKTTNGATPLHYAAQYNPNPAVAALLLDRGANIYSKTTGGATPLHYAAQDNRNSEMITLLLERGAGEEINARDRNGHTALYYAASNTNPAVARLLIDLGLEIDADTINAAAKWNTNKVVIALLLDRSGDVLATTNGLYPLIGTLHNAAAYNPEPGVVEVILDRGASIQATTSTRALNDKSFAGVTALHVAAGGNPEPMVIRLLVERGASIHARDLEDSRYHQPDWDKTPLHYAAAHNPIPEISATLLDLGADIEAKTEGGKTPLHLAMLFNSSSGVAEVLLEYNADGNAKDRDGFTPLHMAVVQWHSGGPEGAQLVQMLLDRGADTTIMNNEGRTPCRLAQLQDKYTGTPLMERLCGR